MKKSVILVLTTIFMLFYSCTSTETEISNEQDFSEPEETVQIKEEQNDLNDYVDEIIELNEVIITSDDEEYLRSTNELVDESVTKEEFTDDKTEILRIIDDLADIMEKQDVNKWLEYIEPASIKYYSTPANIRKAQKKLPDRTIQLYGIGDYFKYVFIPSRKRSEVNEIRYISKENVKAVKLNDDNSVNVYYYFVKVDGKWLVHIPALN